MDIYELISGIIFGVIGFIVVIGFIIGCFVAPLRKEPDNRR